jgi:hypothetical protein
MPRLKRTALTRAFAAARLGIAHRATIPAQTGPRAALHTRDGIEEADPELRIGCRVAREATTGARRHDTVAWRAITRRGAGDRRGPAIGEGGDGRGPDPGHGVDALVTAVSASSDGSHPTKGGRKVAVRVIAPSAQIPLHSPDPSKQRACWSQCGLLREPGSSSRCRRRHDGWPPRDRAHSRPPARRIPSRPSSRAPPGP